MTDILSQAEVDALLVGITGDVQADEPVDASGVRNYDVAKQERIIRGRMPALEMIHERFARNLRTVFYNVLRRTVEVSTGPIQIEKYSDFIRKIPLPAHFSLLRLAPLRGHALLVCDASFVFGVVDLMFGGDNRFHVRAEGREFSPVETKVMNNMLVAMLQQWDTSWKSVYEVSTEILRSESTHQFLGVATPSEPMVWTQFTIEIGAATVTFWVALPYMMIEPIRDLLINPTQSEKSDDDDRWPTLLHEHATELEVNLLVELGATTTTLRALHDMTVGDVLLLEAAETCKVLAEDVCLFYGKQGVHAGHYAVELTGWAQE